MEDLKEILRFYREIGASFLDGGTKPADVAMQDLKEIHAEIMKCTRCLLHKDKTKYVPGEGSLTPDIMFIGEGPGETEDRFGRPFIGKAGQLLDRIILKMGYSRKTVFIGNIVKCRPPGNRDPLRDEVAACIPFLQRQIQVLKPKAIVCLGRIALNYLLDKEHAITKVHGKIFKYEGIPLVPTFHPSYIIRQRSKEEISKAKWDVWADMQVVLELVNRTDQVKE